MAGTEVRDTSVSRSCALQAWGTLDFILCEMRSQKRIWGNSLVVQWLGLGAFTAMGPGSTPGQGTKVPQAARRSQKTKQNKKTKTKKRERERIRGQFK